VRNHSRGTQRVRRSDAEIPPIEERIRVGDFLKARIVENNGARSGTKQRKDMRGNEQTIHAVKNCCKTEAKVCPQTRKSDHPVMSVWKRDCQRDMTIDGDAMAKSREVIDERRQKERCITLNACRLFLHAS
jgi:hypothetical protein